MKTPLTLLKLLIILTCTIGATAAFSQTTYTWTGAGDGVRLDQATNWDLNALPQYNGGGVGDYITFNGLTSSNLLLNVTGTGLQGFSGGDWGLRVYIASNQVNPVTFLSGPGTIRFNNITVDSGAGAFTMGDTTANILNTLWGGVNPEIHTNINNSAFPVTIQPNVEIRAGGGGPHTFIFDGSGDWILNTYLNWANGSGMTVTKSGTGTLTWTGTNVGAAIGNSYPLGSPLTINNGKLILKSSDIYTANQNLVDNGTLKFDAAGATSFNTVSGTGSVEVANGQLTFLSGNGTLSGNINLTGGKLIAGGAENSGISGPLGTNGTISFTGGTLGYSPNNAFDYSPRLSTAAGQAYSIDTAGQSVTFATGLSSAGGSLAKLGAGTLTLTGSNSYGGPTTIGAGKVVFQGAKTGAGNITVADGAGLGVFENGTQITPGSLTLGTSADVTVDFNNVTNTAAAPLAPGSLSSAGTVNININSGTFNTFNQAFPLLTGSPTPAVTLASLSGAGGFLSTNGNTIQLVITNPPYIWSGAVDGNWNTTTINWVRSGAATNYSDGVILLFDDSATNGTSVTLNGVRTPKSATFNNVNAAYTVTTSAGNNIGGSANLAKNGGGLTTISGGVNSYTGVTTLGGGTLSVSTLANGGQPSDIGAAGSSATNLVLNGGTLQYTGPGASIDRQFSVGTSGGTIDNEGSAALVFNKPGPIGLVGSGPRTLTLAGTVTDTNTLVANIIDSPGGGTSLAKSGPGLWILTGTNSYTGSTTIGGGGGRLQIGAGGATGTLGLGNVVNNGTIDFNRTGTLTNSGAISGSGTVINDGAGTVIFANNNSYQGSTTINAGTVQVGNGGSTGSLAQNQPIINNSLLIFNTVGKFVYNGNGLISGTGNVIVRGNGGLVKAHGANTYTGWTQIDAGATFQPTEGNSGQLVSSVVTNNGALKFVAQDPRPAYAGNIVGNGRVLMGANNFNAGSMTLTGTNTYTGGTLIGDNELILGDGFTTNAGSIVGNVIFTNNFDTADDNLRRITFFRPEDFTFSGNITTNFSNLQTNLGVVQQSGSGTLTLTGNNTYGGGTILNSGLLVVGNGGATGSLGSGPVTLNSGNPMVINRSGSLAIPGTISGAGGVILVGPATVTLSSTNNSYGGVTTVSNGTLVVNSTGGSDVNVNGGTLIVGGVGVVATLNVGNNMNINSGTVMVSLNKAAPSTNTFFSAAGTVNVGTGILKLLNLGPLCVPGDKFTIFNQPVNGGAGLTVVSPGFTVTNNLAVDGSVTVITAQPAPTITSMVSGGGNQLNLSWPSAWIGGVHLQVLTNSLSLGPNNWVTIQGTDTNNTFSTTIDRTKRTVFYRLIAP